MSRHMQSRFHPLRGRWQGTRQDSAAQRTPQSVNSCATYVGQLHVSLTEVPDAWPVGTRFVEWIEGHGSRKPYLPFPGWPAREPSMSESVVAAVSARAGELFASREMYCAEAILTAMDEAFSGGLGRERARGLAMGFGEGLGGGGCVCGALSGACLAASWLLSARLLPEEVRRVSRRLHQAFREAHGSPCCRALTRPVKADKAAHFAKCAGLTRLGAELAARAVLEHGAIPGQTPGPKRPGRRKVASLLRRLADRIG